MVSTALEDHRPVSLLPKITIIIDSKSPFQQILASHLSATLNTTSTCEVVDLLDLSHNDFHEALCLFLPELERPVLYKITAPKFAAIQRLILSVSHLIWIAKTDDTKLANPTEGMIAGLLRNIQGEFDEKVFVSIVLQDSENPTSMASSILSVLESLFSGKPKHYEPEYRQIDNRLCINRIVHAEAPNHHLAQKTLRQNSVTSILRQDPPQQLALKMGFPGLLDTFQFEHDIATGLLASGCIQIQVKAAGVNFRDVLVALGLDVADNLGLECSGVVTQADDNNAFAIGDRVSCFVEGSLATSVRCQIHAACKIPDGVSFQTAAAFPVVFTSAYYSLIHVARLQAGESILIHSGAGGLGQACIQLAKLLNTEIFVTVGNNDKKRFLMEEYHVPEDHIFSSRSLTFASRIHQATNSRGVDVIINSLAGEALKSTWNCIAPFGRFIEVGKKDILSSGKLPMLAFSRGASFTGVDLVHVRNNDTKLFNKLMQIVVEMLDKGEITIPSPLHVFDASKIESAFRLLESGKSIGKMVINFGDTDLVKVGTILFRWCLIIS